MTYTLHPDARLMDTLGSLSERAREEIEHAGAYALSVLVRRHVNLYALGHHATSGSLGAPPTRHLEDGSAAIVCSGGSVDIPIPGFSRVFHPLDIRPTKAKALTIPINRVSYGVRAGRLAAEGWSLFRISTRGGGPGAGILFGRKSGESEAVALYLLRTRVRIPQDRGMLPTDEEMQRQAAGGVARAILRRSAS